MTLLLLVGAGDAWAATVTYHILTLPIDPEYYDHHMVGAVTGYRLEAVKVVAYNQTSVELPAHYKSPLAMNFKYYRPSDITIGASAVSLYTTNTATKGILYQVHGETTDDPEDDPTPVSEGTAIVGSTAEYYVVYEYNDKNLIAKLDGSDKYNIGIKNKGFFALNRGRNNRPAVVPTAKVNAEMLASEDFSYINNPGSGISPYWSDANKNKNDVAITGSRFFFMFQFEGKDPYNIIIRNAYNKDTTFIEANEDDDNKKFVYKWYKGGQLFSVGTANAFISSDIHMRYLKEYNSANPNPTEMALGTDYETREGYFRSQTGVVWGTYALLNNSDNTGYVFMGTRAVDGSGNVPTPGNDKKYYYLKFENNNTTTVKQTEAEVTKSYTVENFYTVQKVTFKVVTPFYAVEQTDDHIVSVPDLVSQHSVINEPIDTKYLPAKLKRKYCSYTGKFYSHPDCSDEHEITHFTQAHYDETEGLQVYVGYEVLGSIPFQAITPAAAYSTATWYELTDAGSTQEYGRKIKYDGTSAYKNNGANGEYVKQSEFAFVGDPYKLKVLYRKGTEDASANRYVALSTYDTWDIPSDDVSGSFLLRKFNDTGHWSWEAGQTSGSVTYQSDPEGVAGDLAHSANKDAQTITFTINGLTDGKYIKVTKGGTDVAQIVSVTPSANSVEPVTGTSATVTVKLAANTTGADKTMTLTIQEYDDDNGKTTYGIASTITITQGTTSSFAGNTVEYSTTTSTYVKVLELPHFTYTYNIVDKSGRIAVKASVGQDIFSPLSLASIPSIIVSPYLVREELTFYRTYTSPANSRTLLANEITETPAVDNQNIYVKYTTATLGAMPFALAEDQEIFVRLNGQYLYYEDGIVKSSESAQNEDKYKWKLRNRDPYAMLVDNIGARTALSVTGSEVVTVYDDDGNIETPSPSRQKGAWIKLADDLGNDVGLTFDPDRGDAQRFIAKSSARAGVYEVMVATGSGVDASTTYYNIGRPAANTVKIYNNATYRATVADEIKFRLEENIDYTYHLIDRAKHELLTVISKSPELVLPAEFQSPLVGTANYSYYAPDSIAKSGDTYEPTNPEKKLSSISGLYATYTITSGEYASAWAGADVTHKLTAIDAIDAETQAKKLTSNGDYYIRIGESSTYYYVEVTKPCYYDIYVTYEANDLIGFNNTGRINDHPYLLKFLNPLAAGYYLEDGNDKLTTGKIQAVYPYCNGDGNLNIYGDRMRDEQMNGGSSTRPRWVWYFESANNDPYHVRIHSRSTISFNSVSHPTYLETKAVFFNQDNLEDVTTKHIVTGGSLPGVASTKPTEYMILGTEGRYKLVTTDSIDDGETKARRTVNSLEQYWKTYNMLKLHILNISANTNAYSTVESTWVIPDSLRTVLNDSLARRGIGSGNWHSYEVYANATRWNGYNDKSDGKGKKVVEKIEHWFQTFNMGDGSFAIEDADIPAVLVLLDLHGWEIMRLPLPAANYPLGDDEIAALKAYDSPLVDKYYFYSQATKASGCHKYTLRVDDKGNERDQIKVNGVRYSSSSLGDLPPANASGVKSSGVLNDQFVIYTVKEEYSDNYHYNLSYTETKEDDKVTGYNITSETASTQPYLVLQNGRFYKTLNEEAKTSYMTKPIIEHTNPSGGNIYDLIVSPTNHSSINIIDGSGNFIGNNFWYVKPNLRIDEEMGIKWGSSITGAEPLSRAGTQVTYKDKSGFDPYNIQLQLVNNDNGTASGKYLTSHMVSTRIVNGVRVGNYEGTDPQGHTGSTMITLEAQYTGYDPSVDRGSEGYDHTNLQMSNQTFMAVSDAHGNMQLMPRFDHTKRVNVPKNSLGADKLWATTLEAPVDHAKASVENNTSMGQQTTFFVRPQRYIYHIIDNLGREALRYTRGGDDYPTITNHFKSPLATDFTYYSGLADAGAPVESTPGTWGVAGEFKRTAHSLDSLNTLKNLLPKAGTYQYRVGTRGNFTWYSVTVTKGLMEQQITGSFAAASLGEAVEHNIYVRYNYDEDADHDGDRILQGQWFTVQLAGKDLQSSGTIVLGDNPATLDSVEVIGTGVKLFDGTGDKPGTVDQTAKKWQWKFRTAPADSTSDYYNIPDPYAVQIFNRQANYTRDPSGLPNPMMVGIRVPDQTSGIDRFALLSHPSGGYALAVAKTYTDNNYLFLNGASMTKPDAGTPVAADTVRETSFTYKTGSFADNGAQLVVNDDVHFDFVYRVINNDSIIATVAEQSGVEASTHDYDPYLPDSAQSPLLNMDDYLYYAHAIPGGGKYRVITQSRMYTLRALYDDTIYVRYAPYDVDKTSFKVPNKKGIEDSHVVRLDGSVDASLNINGGLPYNIIWYNDNMMQSTDNSAISDGGSHNLDGNEKYVWYFTGNDPYALKIKHKNGKYIDGTTTMVADAANAKQFMLLRKDGYDYGILQVTGTTGADAYKKLTGFGGALTANAATAPAKFVIFGLSVHTLIYRLIIANTGNVVTIPYRNGDENSYTTSSTWLSTDTIHIHGTTQRNLTDAVSGVIGDKYQLGSTIKWGDGKPSHTYCYDAGTVSIGDDLWVPNEFYRPNCSFEYYIEGIFDNDTVTAVSTLDNRFKGLKVRKLMSDAELIDKSVVVNIVYKFDTTLATNTGLGFVTSTDQNLWYTFETAQGATPYLAHYTNAWGLQAMRGAETRYTNDYLWSPLGDVYGFKMYNRYMLKNSGGVNNVMTMNNIAEGKNLYLAVPGTSTKPTGEPDAGATIPADYGIFELIAGDKAGYFRVHPMANNSGTQYYVKRSATDYAVLSASTSDSTDWNFGLDMTLLEPFHQRAGYVGGLTTAGKTAYEAALNKTPFQIIDLQKIVYNDANIIPYTPGYYRLHNQPDVSGISTVRYASGYLHETELTGDGNNTLGPIPMHFFSKEGVTASYQGDEDGLSSGFTVSYATRGDIPIDPTEYDPSTIFYFDGTETLAGNPRSKMQTQGLYVKGIQTDVDHGDAVMTATAGEATTFSVMDIGGAVFLIHDGSEPKDRIYLHYSQDYTVSGDNKIYNLKYFHNSPTDDAKWCLQPVQKTGTKGNGEMPLMVKTHDGGDDYYYTTFYAPFDVLLPDDAAGKTYNAYICKNWRDEGVNPVLVPAVGDYEEGKFVPANTPVIIRAKDESENVKLTLPSSAPSSALSCVFTGSYMEKLLAVDAAHDVYTLGVPMITDAEKDDDYDDTGDITAPETRFANSGVGFYINATPNKESNPIEAMWTRNNRYVLHNKIYYREGSSGAHAPEHADVQFVPVNFVDGIEVQPGEEEPGDSKQAIVGDGCMYDILGRKVATEKEVKDGSWRHRLQPGVYIVDGQKIYVGS